MRRTIRSVWSGPLATTRLLEAKPNTMGELLDKAHCVRWRMEDGVDQELVGGLIGDIRRMAGV